MGILLLQHQSVSAQESVPNIISRPHRNVCTSPYTSMDVCGANGTVDAAWSGYEIQVSERGPRAPLCSFLMFPWEREVLSYGGIDSLAWVAGESGTSDRVPMHVMTMCNATTLHSPACLPHAPCPCPCVSPCNAHCPCMVLALHAPACVPHASCPCPSMPHACAHPSSHPNPNDVMRRVTSGRQSHLQC